MVNDGVLLFRGKMRAHDSRPLMMSARECVEIDYWVWFSTRRDPLLRGTQGRILGEGAIGPSTRASTKRGLPHNEIFYYLKLK